MTDIAPETAQIEAAAFRRLLDHLMVQRPDASRHQRNVQRTFQRV